MTIADFPLLNASLNALSAVLLITGYCFIRAGKWSLHGISMSLALVASSIFLTCYLIFHAEIGSIHFTDPRPIRYFYYILLLTHVVLAFVSVPFIFGTVIPALRIRFDKHRRIARVTLPIWLYVSITGVLVYLLNYQFFPSTEIQTKLHRPSVQTLQLRTQNSESLAYRVTR